MMHALPLRTAVSVAEHESLRIPVEGPLIVLANRPSSPGQEHALLNSLEERRNDWAIWHRPPKKGKRASARKGVGMHRHQKVFERPTGGHGLFKPEGNTELKDVLAAALWLKQGKALILFPAPPRHAFTVPKTAFGSKPNAWVEGGKAFAGALWAKGWHNPWASVDGKWSKIQMRLIQEAGVPVVPLFWTPSPDEGELEKSGLAFIGQRLKAVSGSFSTSAVQQTRPVRLGQRLSPGLLKRLDGPAHLQRYLRARVQCLGLVAERPVQPPAVHGPSSALGMHRHPFLRVVHTPFDSRCLQKEIDALPQQALLLSRAAFDVYQVDAAWIPNLLYEIGRLREIAFQAEGEGSRKPIDLDEYDANYRHLFAWDREQQKLVGAYRLGIGPDLLARQGKAGFYLHSLFHIKDGLLPMLSQSMELGRSFVVPEYQNQRLPLFLLWQGIVAGLKGYPELRYLIGPVSISNRYSRFSRSLMVRYIRAHHFDSKLAEWVRPRKAFRPDFGGLDADALLSLADANTKPMDALIADLEPTHFRMPVLLRQYFAQHARIIGFNVDPDFSDALDGFMVCRIEDLNEAYR